MSSLLRNRKWKMKAETHTSHMNEDLLKGHLVVIYELNTRLKLSKMK